MLGLKPEDKIFYISLDKLLKLSKNDALGSEVKTLVIDD
jgi:hypothetical protein